MELMRPSTMAFWPCTLRRASASARTSKLRVVSELLLRGAGRHQELGRGLDLVVGGGGFGLGLAGQPSGFGPLGLGLLELLDEALGAVGDGVAVRQGLADLLAALRAAGTPPSARRLATGHVGGHDLLAQALPGVGDLLLGPSRSAMLAGRPTRRRPRSSLGRSQQLDLLGLGLAVQVDQLLGGLLAGGLGIARAPASICGLCGGDLLVLAP